MAVILNQSCSQSGQYYMYTIVEYTYIYIYIIICSYDLTCTIIHMCNAAENCFTIFTVVQHTLSRVMGSPVNMSSPLLLHEADPAADYRIANRWHSRRNCWSLSRFFCHHLGDNWAKFWHPCLMDMTIHQDSHRWLCQSWSAACVTNSKKVQFSQTPCFSN